MYKLKLIIRYLLKRRITYVAVLTVALCVFIVMVVMTVMSGLVGNFKEKNHDYVGDCVVGTKSLVGFAHYEAFLEILSQTEGIQAVSPVVKNVGLLQWADTQDSKGVDILGIDPVRHSQVTNFAQTLHYRAKDVARAFVSPHDPNAVGCIQGIDIDMYRNAQNQYVYSRTPPRTTMSLTCFPLTARGAPAKVGTSEVSRRRFHYSDMSRSGIARVDSETIYIPLEQAQNLCMAGQLKRISAIHIKFRSGTSVSEGCDRVAALWERFKSDNSEAANSELFDSVTVESWKAYRRASIAPMEKEEAIMGVMFGFVGITSVFIVFVVFYMIVSHKTKDIGVLKSVGASNWSVLSLFSGFAFVVGLLGSLLGVVAALLFLRKINRIEDILFERFGFQLWDRTIFAIGEIPHRVDPIGLAAIVICAILACLIGALAPGYCAARLRPVETLHGTSA